MEGLKHINKIREYCDYLEEHLLNVEKAWKILQETCKDMNFIWDDYLFWSIDAMVKSHDISKMSAEEFIPYQRNFFPVGEKDSKAFHSAWLHHIDHNTHHWEKWTTIRERMPNEQYAYCVCMVIDWMAMGMKFGDTAQAYYEANSHKINLPEWAVKTIYQIFDAIKRGNEDTHG